MSTRKNGTEGTFKMMDEVAWNEAEDLRYYAANHGDEAGKQDRRQYMINCISQNLTDYHRVLDRAIQFLWTKPPDLDGEVLSLLSLANKIELLRKLILERSNRMPAGQRSDYLARFDEVLNKYLDVEMVRNKVLRRYLINPSGTWLRELVDADDSMVSAWMALDESMNCEHDGYDGWLKLNRR